MARQLLSAGAYVPWIQDLLSPAQYWHDPLNISSYLAGSHYLAPINNELEVINEVYRSKMEELELLRTLSILICLLCLII